MSIEKSAQFISQFASDALSRGSMVANRIGTYSRPAPNVRFSFNPSKPSTKRPPEIGDLLGPDTSRQSIGMLNSEAEKWINKYFPNLNSCFRNQPEEWACGILTGQEPFGLSREVFESVWHEGRDRAYRGASTEQAQIRTEYSLRGFSMPPGAMIAASRNAEIRASEAIADVNRAQILRDSEVKVELVKFAATTAVQLKTGILGVLADFYGNWVRIQGQGQDAARARAQAYSALVSGLSAYYNVELGFQELRLKAAQTELTVADIASKSVTAEAQARVGEMQALGTAARGFADAAGSAASATGSLQAELYSGQVGDGS